MVFDLLMANSFINKYGQYAMDYPYLNALGKPSLKTNLPLIGFFVLLVLSFIIILLSSPKSNVENEIQEEIQQIPERTTGQKIVLYLGLLLMFVGFGSLGLYGFLYVFKYLPEKAEWFTSLPPAAQMAAVNFIGKM